MFSVHLRRIYHTCNKILIRNLRIKKSVPTGPNPGLNKRVAAFQQDGFQITDDDAEEFVEQSESDFYKVGEAYNEHMNETLMGKYEQRHHIIKEKYFKENMPNLLTWSEKEQIRHLATEHSDEWTLERIAASFPVTVPVVKKLLKYPWKPATEQRIARHDASVMRNWRELKEGSLVIGKELRDHFLKFSERTIPPLTKKSVKIDLTQQENLGEFEKIVQRCAAKDNANKHYDASNEYTGTTPDDENKEEKIRKDSKRVTLDKLTEKIKKRLDKGNDVNIPDKIILNTVNASELNNIIKSDSNQIELAENSEENNVTEYTEKNNDPMHIMNYPERIRIPKKAYKMGATYKVNDCYYDHDGVFLYRVLGMSS